MADACGLAALGRSELSALLRGAWVSVLGDSVARLFYAALLRAAGLSPEQRVVVGHRSFEHPLAAGARGSFVWAPYQDNVTDALRTWHAAGAVPDIVVVGASLWHMLHVGDADDHTAALRRVAAAMQQLREARGSAPVAADRAGHARHRQRAPLFFWMSTTALVTDKLLTEEKRNRLTPSQVSMYDARVREEHLLAPDGPCVPLDVHAITEGAAPCAPRAPGACLAADMCAVFCTAACGAVCTADGMHFRNSTYDVLVQQWANAVRLMRRSVRCVTATERSALLRSKLGLAALPSDALCEPVMRLEARERAARAKAEPEQPPAAELTDRTDSTDTNA